MEFRFNLQVIVNEKEIRVYLPDGGYLVPNAHVNPQVTLHETCVKAICAYRNKVQELKDFHNGQ